ncbi:hypothetical protein PCANC_28263 [Puccinia coronata f. sp. avenae]|jgi:hypothetical protein|uniref:Uncharacterized protein n=1 Tax=Puccinia coronata f. sp. avenae TaxID=200324 RepID=A0A2N5TDF0_9BASI|nr:hypothetical protein PCANC_28263 [Puccinia coronata f. sp. avenae]
MVSTLLPFALLALAFSAWPLASGGSWCPTHGPSSGTALGPHSRIKQALKFDDPSPDFAINQDEAHGISRTLAEILYYKEPIHYAPDSSDSDEEADSQRTEIFELRDIIEAKDDSGRSMYETRTAKVMSLIMEDFDTKDRSEKEEIIKRLYLIVRFHPQHADGWATNVIANEENDRTLEALQRGGNYDTIAGLLRALEE